MAEPVPTLLGAVPNVLRVVLITSGTFAPPSPRVTVASLRAAAGSARDPQAIFLLSGNAGSSWFHWRHTESVELSFRTVGTVDDTAHGRPCQYGTPSLFPETCRPPPHGVFRSNASASPSLPRTIGRYLPASFFASALPVRAARCGGFHRSRRCRFR